MLSIRDGGPLAHALSSSIDPVLGDIITKRISQLRRTYDGPLEEIVHFIVVQPGDPEVAIADTLGFSPLCNLVDRARFGDPGFSPSWEWIERHGDWYELAFVLSDDGFGHVLLVQDADGVDPDLLSLCRLYAA